MNDAKSAGFDHLKHYEEDARQFDYFETRTGATAHSERRLREYIISLVPKGSGHILDVGCGSGWVAEAFQGKGRLVCSLDISIENPKRALAKYPSADHVAVVADSYELPFADQSFDLVIAAEIIEHLEDPARFGAELVRVLKPGGVAIVSTPFREKIIMEMCVHCHQLTPRNAHLHSWDEASLSAQFPSGASRRFVTFNNKLLLFARTYPLLSPLPFALWRSVDALANAIVRKPVNCIIAVTK